jgi:hypothetical protein
MGQKLCLPPRPPVTDPPFSLPPSLPSDGTKSNLQTALQSVGDLIANQDGKIQLLQKLMDAVEADVKKRREELAGAAQMPDSRKDVLRETLRWHMQCQVEELAKHELLDKAVHEAVVKHIQYQWQALQSELLPQAAPSQPPSMMTKK